MLIDGKWTEDWHPVQAKDARGGFGLDAFEGGGTGRQWFSVRGVTPANRPARVRAASARVSQWIDAELARRGLALRPSRGR